MRFVVVVEVVVVGLGVVISAASTLVLVTCPCCSEELPFFGNVLSGWSSSVSELFVLSG
jgi:hypothetical protein